MNIKDLPPAYQAQVLRQLGKTASPTAMIHTVGSANARLPPEPKPVSKPLIRAGGKRTPNDNEKGYNAMFLDGKGMFEAVTLKLPGGSRYTPDFVTWDENGRMTAHEVKGAYKLQSQGRAATAFRECVAAFPAITFVWAMNEKGEYSVQRFNEDVKK